MELEKDHLEAEILRYIRFCLESGYYYDDQYLRYLEIGRLIIKKWRTNNQFL